MAYKQQWFFLFLSACIHSLLRYGECGVIHTEMAVPLDVNGVRINGFDIDGDGQLDYEITTEQAQNFETLLSTLMIENDLHGIPPPRAEGDYYNDIHVKVVNVSSHESDRRNHALFGDEIERGSATEYIHKYGFSLQTVPTLGAIGASLMLLFIVVANIVLCWCIYRRYKRRSQGLESNLSITMEHQSAASDSTEIDLSSDMDEVTPQPSTPDPESVHVSRFSYPYRQRQRSLTVCRRDQ